MRADQNVVVVTGGGSGIGRAVTAEHANRGWRVVVVERDRALANRLTSEAPDIRVVVGDVTDDAVLRRAMEDARAMGRLAAWVSNAALVEQRPLADLDDDHVERMLRTNIRAVVTGAHLAVEAFLEDGTSGSIVAISSVHARIAFASHAMYDTSKGAVEALCRTVAAELGYRGIRCNAVAPGAVMTEREVAARRVAPPEVEPIPLAMFSSPAEIAHVAGFLTSPASVAINGAVIAADRGLSVTFLNDVWRSAPPHD